MEDGPLATALRQAGAEPLVVPLIGIDPIHRDDSVAPIALKAFDWIAFTSANGVRMFWARLDASDQTAFRQHRAIAAVGPATARAVAALGATSAVTAPEFVAESLADALGDERGMNPLGPRAAGARSVCSAPLPARGPDVVEQIRYDTVARTVQDETRALILEADAITFTSPSAVHAFVACFGTAVAPQIVCIGPVTANAATEVGLTVSAVAGVYTLGGVVGALAEVFGAATRGPAEHTPATELQ
jgi:uroporphyrinogen-III synthase